MTEYNPKEIEAKWQKHWLDNQLFRTPENPDPDKKKYILVEFPYPSGDGLHVGHAKIYTATDVAARYYRMRGYDVLHPMGWDAFGLPAENSALKYGIHPAELTARNISRFKEQLQSLGLSYDWEKEINTTDPRYYQWTQWIFLQLFKRGLAYEDTIPINWCPSCKTGLANEEVIEGHCERCGHAVELKPMRQWMLKITEYAEQLLDGLDGLDWPGFIKEIQRNWIGRSEGINFHQKVKGLDLEFSVYDSIPQTFLAQTFTMIAPDHPLLPELVAGLEQEADVMALAERVRQKKMAGQFDIESDIEGVFTGRYVENPFGTGDLPIWVSSFVLADYGTGWVNASAHDERDFLFAKKYNIPLNYALLPEDEEHAERVRSFSEFYREPDGVLQKPEALKGLRWDQAREPVIEYILAEGFGERAINYKLRDWVFSRQRYWGEPIPLIHCAKCGIVPVPEDQLPVTLPEVEEYQPTGTGESPLAALTDWVNVECPTCAGPAQRETNTMPQWAGSSWYWIRYVDQHNSTAIANPDLIKQWLPVDIYVGGAEHAVLHLLYGRFWNMVLHDIGAVNTPEPFKKRHIVGLVLGEDGQKMSKSRGNVVNPDDEIQKYGADTVRVFASFMGPFEGSASWTTSGIVGSERFMKRLWKLFTQMPQDEAALTDEINLMVQQTIERVTDSMEGFKSNTAVSALMELLNAIEKMPAVPPGVLRVYALLLAPLAPHLAEEAWSRLGNDTSIATASWPTVDRSVLAAAEVTIPVQVNGKVRGTISTSTGALEADVVAAAGQVQNVARYLAEKDIVKIIYVPDKLLNLVVT